jgi:hypothetical protein
MFFGTGAERWILVDHFLPKPASLAVKLNEVRICAEGSNMSEGHSLPRMEGKSKPWEPIRRQNC